MKVLEKESVLAVYYEVCDILFPSFHFPNKFSPTPYFPYNPVDKSLLSDITTLITSCKNVSRRNK